MHFPGLLWVACSGCPMFCSGYVSEMIESSSICEYYIEAVASNRLVSIPCLFVNWSGYLDFSSCCFSKAFQAVLTSLTVPASACWVEAGTSFRAVSKILKHVQPCLHNMHATEKVVHLGHGLLLHLG